MVAVRVRGHAVRGKAIAQRQARIGVASRASLRGNIGGAERRGGILGIQNQMLAMTVGAIGRITRTSLQGRAVHTFVELPGDFLVALGASSHDVPVADFRLGLPGRLNPVTAVAVRAGGRIFTREDGAPVNTLQVLLDRMKNRNLVPGEKSRIGVAAGTSRGLVSLSH